MIPSLSFNEVKDEMSYLTSFQGGSSGMKISTCSNDSYVYFIISGSILNTPFKLPYSSFSK